MNTKNMRKVMLISQRRGHFSQNSLRKVDHIKKIIIIQTAFIGDTILITPLIHGVRQLFPLSQIDVLAIPQTAPLLENNPDINQIITFDKRVNKRRAVREAIKRFKSGQYDMAISPHKSITTISILLRSRIKLRLGFKKGFASVFLTHSVPYVSNMTEIGRNLHLLSILGNRIFSHRTRLYPGLLEVARANELLAGFKEQRKPIIALAPGSVWFTKRWPEEYFIRLTAALSRDDYLLIFTGSNNERALCQRIIDNSGAQKVLNLAGETTLLESAAVIDQCNLLICNDSGTMHIANAVETDVIAFFGPTVREFGFFPYREPDRVFEVNGLSCRPCGKHGGKACPKKHFRCMRDIDSSAVYREVVNRLERACQKDLSTV